MDPVYLLHVSLLLIYTEHQTVITAEISRYVTDKTFYLLPVYDKYLNRLMKHCSLSRNVNVIVISISLKPQLFHLLLFVYREVTPT